MTSGSSLEIGCTCTATVQSDNRDQNSSVLAVLDFIFHSTKKLDFCFTQKRQDLSIYLSFFVVIQLLEQHLVVETLCLISSINLPCAGKVRM